MLHLNGVILASVALRDSANKENGVIRRSYVASFRISNFRLSLNFRKFPDSSIIFEYYLFLD